MDYKNANIECIQKSIYNFDWTRAFQNRNCKEKCKTLSETLLNIFHNFIPHGIKKLIIKILNGLINRLNYLGKSDPN